MGRCRQMKRGFLFQKIEINFCEYQNGCRIQLQVDATRIQCIEIECHSIDSKLNYSLDILITKGTPSEISVFTPILFGLIWFNPL